MGKRRAGRGVSRSDKQIMGQDDDVLLPLAVGRGEVAVEAANRMHLRRLAREDLLLAGFGVGARATLLPRGQRIVAAARGELPSPLPD